jgi:hypothetical protein
MKHILAVLGLVMACSTLPVHAETTWNTTGPQGGTAHGQFNCEPVAGGATCQGSATYTAPQGRVFMRQTARVFTQQGSMATMTTADPYGRTVTTTRERHR